MNLKFLKLNRQYELIFFQYRIKSVNHCLQIRPGEFSHTALIKLQALLVPSVR